MDYNRRHKSLNKLIKMSTIGTVTQDTWFIAHNADYSVIHYGFVYKDKELDSGQPIIEEFYNEAAWLIRLAELGIVPDPPFGPEE